MTDCNLTEVSMTIDGEAITARIPARHLLCDFLREQPRVGGVHVACGHGVCGACTVALDGEAVRSCLLLAVQADGAVIHSIRSLGLLERGAPRDGGLTPLQRAFREYHALQCGFCTPGLLISTALFLAENRAPGRAEILDHLNGHLCRCTGYANIVAAIESVLR